ncbi:hypothetical protein C7T35_01420 [Variovorax sp. WS11]|uniref:hypothetical protein n=1 Tax=Variovorax sp. WS11 TaxID=1105204 RepID=UPI000D0DD27E|nr:hypothetical protein [Variovorax sp. WS11]NDZ11488.1 hypothetical protein [Variovorax sp. WS11]PSL86654.1 hypothetical protein C7T35_01420 [Variovorax sp. WS11]
MALSTGKLGSMSPGVNNRLEPTQLGRTLPDRSKATYLYAGENIDITGRGYLKRRRGFTLAQSGTAAHSVWGDETEGYLAIGNDLLHLQPDGDDLVPTSVLDDLPELAAISYVRMPDGDVIWSNARRIGRLRGASALPLATPRPSVSPSVSLIAGALPPGRYQLAFTEVGALGESGSTVPVAVEVPENGGIRVTGLGAGTLVYMTGPNGSVFNATFTDAGDIVTLANNGPTLRSLLLADMPAGQVLRHYKGSLLVAAGRLLCFSEPYYYGLFNPSKGYIPFPAPITVVEPCESGVFVCADRTYWLAGGLLDTSPVAVLPYGGLQGSGGSVRTADGADAVTQAFWLSPRGLVIGTPSGNASNVQEHALKFGAARAGATLFREQDGAHHILAARQEAARPAAAAADAFFPVETIVKDTDL